MTRKRQNAMNRQGSNKALPNSTGQVKQIVERILNKRSEKKWAYFSGAASVTSLTAVY